MPIKPTKIKSFSKFSEVYFLRFSFSFLYARASTLSALDAMREFCAYISSLYFSVILSFLPSFKTYLHRLSTLSSAPFVKTYLSPLTLLTVDIIFLSLSKGTSPTRENLPSKSSLFAPKR